MVLRDILKSNTKADYLKYFDYYKKLGYTDEQSFLLTLYPYGNASSWEYISFYFYRDLYLKQELNKKGVSFSKYICDLIIDILSESEDIVVGRDILSYGKEYIENEKSAECRLDGTYVNYNVGGIGGQSLRGSVSRSMSPDFCVQSMPSPPLSVIESSLAMPIQKFAVPPASKGSINLEDSTSFLQELDENISSDSYAQIEEKGFYNVFANPTSTFRMTSNTAAFGILRKNKTRKILKSMVRIEEILNNFEYNLMKPTKRIFNINTEVCDLPNSENKLLFVGVQGKDTRPQKQNITILLDTSGSMSDHNKETQLAICTIVSQMKDGDILNLVTYSNIDHTVFQKYTIKKNDSFEYLIDKLYTIQIKGYTFGSKGIETAYNLAKELYIEDGINRIILMTDGDLNFGITSKDGLKNLVLSQKDEGIFLSVLGVGLYNYKDDVLEVLAKNGNGNYCTIDCLEDIEENILDKYNSLVFTLAKDVKAQVEFNPKFVKKYRLIGYENRTLIHEQFKDDSVISEPFGSGNYGVALYELVMQEDGVVPSSDLEYQTPILKESDNICTVKVRYKQPLGIESEETQVKVRNKDNGLKGNLLLAYTIYNICEKLRDSDVLDANQIEGLRKMISRESLDDLYLKNKDKFDVLLSLV